ncbi:hypothetical protein VHEMI09825 [[Torrubiella] hemipterigena]|uniref:Peptidase S8/S53 domain-containing protein n=1 Tax=[Torrubiella] hemipterigena TaxID=1531966 RepID=A0A0A1TH95_9HYPO|nr:hypothetical protein VHEMI09825 [[Torrubiella] hemipterigena]
MGRKPSPRSADDASNMNLVTENNGDNATADSPHIMMQVDKLHDKAKKNAAGFSGVAPGVMLGHYKVFGYQGGTTEEVVIEAALMAAQENPDIISVSIGSHSNWPGAFAVLMNRLAIQRDIVPVMSNGNAGWDGGLSINAMALGDNVLGVASFDNTETPTVHHIGKVSVNAGEMANFTHAMSRPGSGWDGTTMPVMALSYDTTTTDQACEPLPNDTPSLKDKIILVRIGGCHMWYKAGNLAAKGATHLIFYSDTEPSGASTL